MVSLHVNEEEKYVPHFASLTEYLVNPAIRKKNYLVLKELTDHFLPYLEQNPQYFSSLKSAALSNLSNCYNLNGPNNQKEAGIAGTKAVKRFFDEQADLCSRQEITIHKPGFKDKLTVLEAKFHRANINERRFSDVPFLQRVEVRSLPGGMVALDQLPKFQDSL